LYGRARLQPAVSQARILTFVPRLPSRGASRGPRVIVLGDLALDVVVAPVQPIEPGTDVPGRVSLRQGGSAANTARWFARLGARATLIAAVGRDALGRSLVQAMRSDGLTVRATRVAGRRTGRIGVVIGTRGERSFVADRGAADLLRPGDLRPGWFRRVELLHLPAYSLIGEPLSSASRRAIELTRDQIGLVSLDLASIGPLLASGRRAALALIHSVLPDILLATATEARATLGSDRLEALLDLAPIVAIKRGSQGATLLAGRPGSALRFEVATRQLAVTDTTGAGDAFDAGFLVSWLASRQNARSVAASLRRAAVAGHRAAARELVAPKVELNLG
jgi:sugar/nucleoside kinase (ribokinase family)